MASTDARPIPLKNTALRITFPILDADGDLVTAASALDSEVSIDGGTFADCTNEATEIATSSGMYYLDLTSGEMNGDTIAIIVKTSTSGAKTTPIVLYPQESDDIRVSVTHFGGTAGTFSSGRPEVNTTHVGGTSQTARDLGASVLISPGTGTGQLDVTSGVVKSNLAQILGTALTETAGLLAAGFKKFFNVATPTGTVNSLPDAVAGATGGVFIAGSNAATTVNITGNLSGSVGSIGTGGITAGSFAAGAIDNAAIATDAIGSAELATTAVTEIQSGLATAAALVTAQADLDDIQARLPAALINGHMDASVAEYQTGMTPLQPTTAGRTLDVALTGEAGLDFSNVKQATLATTLTNITVPTVTTVTSVTALGTNALTAASLATDAADEVAVSVWERLTSALTTTGSVGKLLVDTLDTAVSTRATPAQVKTQVVDALSVDTYVEPTGAPAATVSLATKIGWLFTQARNKRVTTSTQDAVRNDSDTASIATAVLSDDGTSFIRSEYV